MRDNRARCEAVEPLAPHQHASCATDGSGPVTLGSKLRRRVPGRGRASRDLIGRVELPVDRCVAAPRGSRRRSAERRPRQGGGTVGVVGTF